MNFYNIKFDNTSINIKNGQCEDSLNVINSYGKLSLIKINDSFQDAIDFKNRMQKRNKNVGAIVYAITEPKERLYPVEVPIA